MHYCSHIALSALRNIFIAFIALTFVACSNDDITSSDIKENHDSTFTLYIPDIERETRATFQVTQAEAGVENIWFFAYDAEKDITQKPIIALDIKEKKANNTPFDYTGYLDYAPYDITDLEEGKRYRIYVLANISAHPDYGSVETDYYPGYVSGGSHTKLGPDLQETSLRSLILEFTNIKHPKPGTIPMACYYTEIKQGVDSKSATVVTDGKVTIKENENLYADLTMICSKIRYTLLFDNTDFSKDFGSDVVDFSTEAEKTYAGNVTCKVALKEAQVEADNKFNGYFYLDLKKVAYPSSTSAYLDIENQTGDKISLADLPAISDGSDWAESDKKRAWQGTTYLPENPNPSAENYITSIFFTPMEGANIDASKCKINLYWDEEEGTKMSGKGPERGAFYDVVAKIKNPRTIEFNVSVKVNPWSYESNHENW